MKKSWRNATFEDVSRMGRDSYNFGRYSIIGISTGTEDWNHEEGGMIKLSDADLSRWIAEKLEPEPEFARNIGETDYQIWLRSNGAPVSIGQMWALSRIDDGVEAKPRDMVSDPAMTVMLMEKLPDGYMVYMSDYCSPTRRYCCCPRAQYTTCMPRCPDSYPRLGRCVAQEFALANGWPL